MAPAVQLYQDILGDQRLPSDPLKQVGSIFEVVGGKDVGGIKVRVGKDTTSAEAPARLASGSRVRALEVSAGRVRYELEDGEGPASGWISLRVGGKDLLVNVSLAQEAMKAGGEGAQRYALRVAHSSSLREQGPKDGRLSFPLRQAPGWLPARDMKPAHEVLAALGRDASESGGQVQWERAAEEDQVVMCEHCSLPLGQVSYTAGPRSKVMMHAECMAQFMLREMREDEDSRKAKEKVLKQSRRDEYDIGWTSEVIPRNVAAAEKLGLDVAPQGMCCLVLSDEEGAIRVSPTLEPGAAVNLEYLSTCLQVRRLENREPLFSLDPIDPGRPRVDGDSSMQFKRFEPEWLAGTRVGEVMFQADYHLKELSMGEFEQPVLGMRSCFDLSREDGCDEDWSAREWFVVRNAEIHVSEDQVVIPFLKMGVEAREQLLGADGLEDAPLTRDDHPLVRYAEDFTRNFDLIAERKSVVFQLREVAKASVLAKYLLESEANLDDAWFSLADGGCGPCCLEVPQLWHDRCYSQVEVCDGEILDTDRKKGKTSRRHGVYGGVDFGIDRFRLAAPSRVAASVLGGRVSLSAPSSTLMAATQQRLALGTPRAFARLAGPLSEAATSMAPTRVAASLGVPSRLAAPVSSMSMAATLRAPSGAMSLRAPQGVDLSLDKFNLSSPTVADGEVQSQDPSLVIGDGFWSMLSKDAPSALPEEDKSLLQNVFNASLSDRRQEGASFQPPPTGSHYLQKLQKLVHAEREVRARRKEHFLSNSFDEEDAGPLFPSSWTSSFQGKAVGNNAAGSMLQARHDLRGEAPALREALRDAAPEFDRRAEDGERFRIYRFGSLEVRTTQELDGDEVIGAVFSLHTPMQAWGGKFSQAAGDFEKFTKATEYVEKTREVSSGRRSYVVLETEEGHVIVTEKLQDGMATWQENRQDLEDRNSLAKVVRTTDCSDSTATVRDIKGHQLKETRLFGLGMASPEKCEQYAQIVYCRAAGQHHGFSTGFLSKRQAQQQLRSNRPRQGNRAAARRAEDPARRNYAVEL